MCSKASCLGLGEPGDRGMEQSKPEVALVNGSHLTRRNGHGETSFRRRLPFRALHSFLDLRSLGYSNATQGNKDRTGGALSNTYLLRAAFHRSLSSVRPNEAKTYDEKQLILMTNEAKTYDEKQLIGFALATSCGIDKHLGYIPCIPSKAMG